VVTVLAVALHTGLGDGTLASPKEVADHIRSYETAYYDELRANIAQHHVPPGAFPDFLKGANRIVATLGRDGVVIVHWRAEENSFEFNHRPRMTVSDILKDQRIGELTYQQGERPPALRMQGPHWIMDTGERQPITELGWKTVEVNPDTDAATWSEERARIQAQTDVATFADAHLMDIDVLSAPPNERLNQVIDQIARTIREFEQLLASNPTEQQIRRYLTAPRSHILLHHSARDVVADKALDSYGTVDLVVEGPEGQYSLVKVGSTEHSMLTSEGAETDHLADAREQVEAWLEWLSQHGDQAGSVLPGATEVEGWIILGRRRDVPLKYRHLIDPIRGETGRIRVKTYDDLLDFARQQITERRALDAMRIGPAERLAQQFLELVPRNTWFASSELVNVVVQAFRVYRVPYGTMPILPSMPLVMDFNSIQVRAALGRDIILYPDPESFHLFPAPNGSFEEGTQEVWVITPEGEFIRTTDREMWRSTKDGVLMLLLTPSMTDAKIGHPPTQVLPTVREKLTLTRSAIITTLGHNAAFEQLFEIEIRAASDASQIGAITSSRLSPTTYDPPKLDGFTAETAQQVVEKIHLLDDETRSRVLLALRWYLLAQKHSLEQDESNTDIFVSYWVALEALAMPDTTNIGPVKSILSEIHNVSSQQVGDTFPIGRLFDLRSKILHQGHLLEIRWELLVFMDDLFTDTLLHILGMSATPKTSAYLDGSARNYLPS
jgi:hypothetical protein